MRQDAGAARHIWYSLGRYGWCATAFLLYFCFTCYQLGLPGLHYDEAREAGVNAMEILTGAPASLFRDVGLPLFGYRWPLMVQDYIGALNVYLALPFLWLTGIGVPNLRILPILIGACTLILVERTISEWDLLWTQDAQLDKKPHAQTVNAQTPFVRSHAATVPLSRPGLLAITLLVASPSFVFWSRQGIFVTNITQPLVFAALWHGIRWLRLGRGRALMTAAFWAGCALYAKLLAIWILGPFAILVSGWWLWRFRSQQRPRLTLRLCSVSLIAFLVPLLPLVWFNLESAGTLQALTANVGTSYYGVDNLAIWHNLPIRLAQLQRVLAGNHFWYLGGLYGNPLAEWGGILLLGGVVLLSLRKSRRGYSLAPGLLLLLAFIASLFTISDLFQTHYALLHPLAISVIALVLDQSFFSHKGQTVHWRTLGTVAVCLWLLLDIHATVRYHIALTRSGGLADHADASYHLAYYLRYQGVGAPIALDWGFDAPIRYLSEGTVTPLEIFGYGSPQQPDSSFESRLQPFMQDSTNRYLLHAPTFTVFQGRREVFFAVAAERHLETVLEASFGQRDGTPLYELWQVRDIGPAN